MVKDPNFFNILVIEDNPGDYLLVEDYLSEQISEPIIVQAESFSQACSILMGQNSFDVILLDLTLPDKSGQHLIMEILKMASECPVIILTGHSDIEFSIQSISRGVSDYLLKDELNGISLYKSIIYCIERRRQVQELKESEKRYSDLFHLSPQPMWVYDLESLLFLDVNDAAIKHYGYSHEEFLSMTIKQIRTGEIRKIEAGNGQPFYQDHRFFYGICKHIKKNGEVIDVDVQINQIQFNGKSAQIVIANDVTERSRYVNTIEDQNKLLQEIAWIQSHVVRAPLARIMGLIDLIKNYALPDTEKNELLKHLIDSANDLDNVIKEIADKTYQAKNLNT